ncbi:MAG TPA: glycosyltransferase [Flavisolibacter sp.]|nr:glycosyltransferase [Flavisolibacter sp.]
MTIAVLLTTFNRRQKTLACLESLKKQTIRGSAKLEVFLTDDNSADGTAEAVLRYFPGTHVYKGTGFLYWAGGMRQTWEKAREINPDFYLLLNDDTVLDNEAIETLLETSFTPAGKNRVPAISIGSTRDTHSGTLSYGGWQLQSRKRWKSSRVHSDTAVMDCDFGNANIMLVPWQVVSKIGILAPQFTHSLADYDYGLRAKKAGFAVKVAPGFLGSCVDDHGHNWKPQSVPLKERIRYMKSPKGLAYSEYLHFIREHFPLSYPSAFCKLWMKTFFPFIWERFKK